ncbi:MAG: S8 family serine peptidase [Oceanipulchritudo sp.]
MLILLSLPAGAVHGAMGGPPVAHDPDNQPPGREGRWLIRVGEGEDPREAARSLGARYLGPLKGVGNHHRVRFVRDPADRGSAGEFKNKIARQLDGRPAITAFEQEPMLVRYPRSFIPADPLFPDQWHLENVGQSGGLAFADAQVRPAWDLGLSGEGVTIAIVDEGIQYRHPDLEPNWVTGSGYDYNDDDTDPSPSGSDDRHGTAVAGISLAASNTTGVVGLAYNARLIPLRLIGRLYEAGEEAEALSYRRQEVDIYNNSWGPSDDAGVRYANSSSALRYALEDNVTFGRGGLGNIYVWAAGNGGLYGDNSNFDGYNSLPFTISVGAVGDDDIKAGYSEPGANLLLVAPSGGRGGGILTTDNTGSSGYAPGDEYDGFSGTSAAAPIVSGVVALMLEERPDLNWRDVQQILALTAVPVDFADEDWKKNGAGHWVNHGYGFGRVDARAAVLLARDWVSLPSLSQPLTGQQTRLASLIQGVTSTSSIRIEEDIEVQFVRVFVNLSHSDWGDLRIELVSPEGTASVLSEPHANANNSGDPGTWTYLSTRCLGESSRGNWILRITDEGAGGSGQWTSWALEILGHDWSARTNRPPSGDDLYVQSVRFPISVNILEGLTDPDGDPLSLLSIQYPRSGTLETEGKGRFRFDMGPSKDGTDTFSVLYGDGRGGTFRRMVRILDPRPVGRNDLYPVASGTTVQLPVLSNDLDPDGDPLRLTTVSGEFVGQASISETDRIEYTAPPGYEGVVRIQYGLSDDSDGESTGWATAVVSASPDIALDFDGEDDFVRLAPTSELDLSDRFTAEAWIYPESYGEYVTGFGRIFDRDTFIFFLNGFDHAFYNDRSLVAYFIQQNGAYTAANSPANVLDLDRWQHVAVSYDSTNSASPVRMYVDGQSVPVSYPIENTFAPTQPLSDNTTRPLYIGEAPSGARAFKGRMSELRIWETVVPPATVQFRHDRRMSGSESGLRLYFPLDQTLEPEVVSTGSLKRTAPIFEAQRIPMTLPWEDLADHYILTVDSGNGWWAEQTLGWIYGDRFPWLYLPSMGWAYTGHRAGSGDFLLNPAQLDWGWLHTSRFIYPWIYRYSGPGWMWYYEPLSEPGWFYDSVSSGWVSSDPGFPLP